MKVLATFEGYHLAHVGRRINEIVSDASLGRSLTEQVDFEKSAEELRTVVLPGIDDELDRMRWDFDGLGHLLSQVARRLSERLPADVHESLNVIYFPQIGFLTTLPIDPATNTSVYEGSDEGPWERMFSTEYGCSAG